MKPLPIGIQHFEVLRQKNYVYIDKTQYIYQLANLGGSYFLSRPRRFGKSLFIDTLECLFQGKKELFDGLYIADKWNWKMQFPSIRISFSNIDYQGLGLEQAISKELRYIAIKYGINLNANSIGSMFRELIESLASINQKVVILVDEYDKPIIDYLETDRIAIAQKNQDILKTFYSSLKDAGKYIHLSFITGVSKFSKISLFSDLNHLQDLTFSPSFSAAYGYTHQEMLANFDDYITQYQYKYLNDTAFLEKIREWYNGYSWDGQQRVYNPFGLLNFFANFQFRNYWFDSGTPTFLVKLLMGREQYDFENYRTSMSFLNQYSLDNIETVSLLFQTGYLTIKEKGDDDTVILDYPNREVRDSFYQYLMTYLGQRSQDSKILVKDLSNAFYENNLEEAEYIIQQIFNALPYDIYTKNNESLYHGMIHILFHYIGLNIESEVHSKRGRLDAVVQTPTHIFIFEFKLDKSAKEAISQIINKDYASKFRHSNKKIIGIGINFHKDSKTFDKWEIVNL